VKEFVQFHSILVNFLTFQEPSNYLEVQDQDLIVFQFMNIQISQLLKSPIGFQSCTDNKKIPFRDWQNAIANCRKVVNLTSTSLTKQLRDLNQFKTDRIDCQLAIQIANSSIN